MSLCVDDQTYTILYAETSAYKIQTPENYPEESIQDSDHGEKFE